MYWNKFCLFTLMCFTSPTPELNSGSGMCSYFKSEDVGKKSLVMNASLLEQSPNRCLKHGPFNTILISMSESDSESEAILFSSPLIEYEHLIILNNVMPVNFCPNKGKDTMKVTSLTVFRNNNLQTWSWLECTKFKHIRIDSCVFKPYSNMESNNLILSDHLLTLTLVNITHLNPWNDLDYQLAPNLRELSINHFDFSFLLKKSPNVFPKLKRLNLENNKIMNLAADFFMYLPKLDKINLEGNLLEKLHLEFQLAPGKLLLDNNPLEGDEKTCIFLKSAGYVAYDKKDQICKEKKT